MSISAAMTKEIVTLDLDGTLADAKDIFESNFFHHLLILDEDRKLMGLVTDRILYKHLSPTIGTHKETPNDSLIIRKKVHQIMVRDVITTTPELPLSEAAFLFYKHSISCLPVVNEQYQPIGILTWRDIIKVLAVQFVKKQ